MNWEHKLILIIKLEKLKYNIENHKKIGPIATIALHKIIMNLMKFCNERFAYENNDSENITRELSPDGKQLTVSLLFLIDQEIAGLKGEFN